MAGRSGRSRNTDREDSGLSDGQFSALAERLEKHLLGRSRELRDLLEQTRSEFTEVTSAVMTSAERQGLETLSAIGAATDSVRRFESLSADLTAQVASLRDYIARQQEMVKRFQDGYDWSVLKNFCNRIIRCIDDVRKRMETADEITEAHRTDLLLIHDQLVFALDGSGIEQFQPEPGEPYSGLEKTVEVVGRDGSGEGEPGCVSSVVAPGYTFYVNDELRRLVRPAKVILHARRKEGSDEVE